MKLSQLLLPGVTLAAAAALLVPTDSQAFSTIGGSLFPDQRDFRVHNNFTDAAANDNTTANPNFPGFDGAELAIWKACTEWASQPHGGTGAGDPTQTLLGNGGANFDAMFVGNAPDIGGANSNVHSELTTGGSGGTLAYCETPINDGWRIRYLSNWTWRDGPGSVSSFCLQGVATHEYGHALGLGHSSGSATMRGSIHGSGVADRSIEQDDINGVRFVYGVADPTKPVVSGVAINGGLIVVTGSNFNTSNNEVWFTRAAEGGGNPIKVLGAPSTNGNTRIEVVLPVGAGSGDVIVKVPNNAHRSVSNAWPFDATNAITCEASSFCATSPNSVGPGAVMDALGSSSIAANDFQLLVSGLPIGTIGIFYAGNQEGVPTPFGNGLNCITGSVLRFGAGVSDIFGSVQYPLDFGSYPGNQMSSDGTPWYTQFWYRNPAGGGAGFNTSDGIRTLWCD